MSKERFLSELFNADLFFIEKKEESQMVQKDFYKVKNGPLTRTIIQETDFSSYPIKPFYFEVYND